MRDQPAEEQRLKEDSDRLSDIFFIYQKPKTKNQKRFLGAANPREETMIGALARRVKDGDWAACGRLSPLPAAAWWLAQFTHAPRAQVLVAGLDWPCSEKFLSPG